MKYAMFLRVAGFPALFIYMLLSTGGKRCAPLFGVTRIIAISRKTETLETTKCLEPELVQTIATDVLMEDWESRQLLTEHVRTLNEDRGVDGVVDFLPAFPHVPIQTLFAMRKGGSAVLARGNYEELVVPYGRIRRALGMLSPP